MTALAVIIGWCVVAIITAAVIAAFLIVAARIDHLAFKSFDQRRRNGADGSGDSESRFHSTDVAEEGQHDHV